MITEKPATFKMMRKTNVAFLYLDTYISWYRNKFLFEMTQMLFSADATRLENGTPDIKELVCSTGVEKVCNSCATYISHII
jgi:hypothetical protein